MKRITILTFFFIWVFWNPSFWPSLTPITPPGRCFRVLQEVKMGILFPVTEETRFCQNVFVQYSGILIRWIIVFVVVYFFVDRVLRFLWKSNSR